MTIIASNDSVDIPSAGLEFTCSPPSIAYWEHGASGQLDTTHILPCFNVIQYKKIIIILKRIQTVLYT